MTRIELDRKSRILVTVSVMGGIFLASMDVTAVGPAMPRIVAALGGGELYAWGFIIYGVLSTTTTPVFGRLADRHGRRPVMLAGIGLFLLGSAACGAAPTMPLFLVSRGVQGVGAGALVPAAFTLVGDLYQLKERARIQGWLSGVWGLSSVVGPLVGGTLVDTVGWRWIFYINIPVGLIAAVIVARALAGVKWESRAAPLDLLGGTFFSAAVLLVLAATKLDAPLSYAAAAAGASLFVAFVWRERVAEEPLFDLSLFRIPVYRAANLAGFFAGGVLIGLTAFLPVYVMNVRGEGARISGFMLTPLSAGWVLAATISGRLLLRRSVRRITLPGLAMLAAATFAISRITPQTPPWVVLVLLFAAGTGFGSSFTVFLVAVQEATPLQRRGQATSGVQFFRQIGGALGVAALEIAFVARLAHPELLEARPGAAFSAVERAEIMAGFGDAFLLAGGLALVAFLSALPVRRRRTSPPSDTTSATGESREAE